MFESLITSKTRVKLLTRLFLNAETTAYLRGLESEFGESTNAIRVELNRFESIGLLVSRLSGNKKIYQANETHPYFSEINRLLRKFVGIDHIIDQVIQKTGHLIRAFVTGDFARGIPGDVINIALIGSDFNYSYLDNLVKKAEENLSFSIRYRTLTLDEEQHFLDGQEHVFLIWSAEP